MNHNTKNGNFSVHGCPLPELGGRRLFVKLSDPSGLHYKVIRSLAVSLDNKHMFCAS